MRCWQQILITTIPHLTTWQLSLGQWTASMHLPGINPWKWWWERRSLGSVGCHLGSREECLKNNRNVRREEEALQVGCTNNLATSNKKRSYILHWTMKSEQSIAGIGLIRAGLPLAWLSAANLDLSGYNNATIMWLTWFAVSLDKFISSGEKSVQSARTIYCKSFNAIEGNDTTISQFAANCVFVQLDLVMKLYFLLFSKAPLTFNISKLISSSDSMGLKYAGHQMRSFM